MLNHSLMMFGNKPEPAEDAAERPEQTSAPIAEGEVIDNISEGELDFPMPELNDPFDCLPPNEPQLVLEEEENVRREVEENETFVPSVDENTEYIAEIEPDEEAVNNTVKIIDGVKRAVITAKDALKAGTEITVPKRQYTNVAKFRKATFAKTKNPQQSVLPKVIMGAVAAVAAGIYFGLEANSYYLANAKRNPTWLNCTFGWLADPPTIRLSPFYSDIFFGAFACTVFIVGAILLLMWDSASGKKRRREGKEHGASRLATPSDFRKFQKRFMD